MFHTIYLFYFLYKSFYCSLLKYLVLTCGFLYFVYFLNGMKLVHGIKVTVFSKPEDEQDDVIDALLTIFPFKLADEKLKLNITNATSFEDRRIKIIEVILERQKHIKPFLDNIFGKLDEEQKDLLLKQASSRLDEENNFFIRLDKDKLQNNEYWITDSGNCYHIKLTIAAFPKTRENALKVVELLFAKHL